MMNVNNERCNHLSIYPSIDNNINVLMFHHWPTSDSLLLTVAVGLFSSTANYAGMSRLISRRWAKHLTARTAGPLHSRCRARVAGWDKVTPAGRGWWGGGNRRRVQGASVPKEKFKGSDKNRINEPKMKAQIPKWSAEEEYILS